jgi:hypothetical protein
MQEHLEFQEHTSSDENYRLIKEWLSKCTSSHKTCDPWSRSETKRTEWKPTRLVDVGTGSTEDGTSAASQPSFISPDYFRLLHQSLPGSAESFSPPSPRRRLVQPVPRLVGAEELSIPVRYLTLSHCWGEYRIGTMNMASVATGEITQDMIASQTFQDAFAITRRLGFRHIWIDSLCIVQDDVADWAREAALMSDVYGHSVLNLVAAHARDGRDGCFHVRDILSVRPCQIPNPFNRASEVSFLVYPVRIEKIYHEEVRSSPAYKRAWILQERLLAARTLYFGKNQLVWACGELEACEAFPCGANYGSLRPFDQNPVDQQGVRMLLNDGIEALGPRQQRISEAWARIVKMYTTASMIRPSDKLVALQGIATRAQEHIMGDYLAGLWKRTDKELIWSLLWFVDSAKKERQRPTEYRAPSWSWASIDGNIEMSTADPRWNHRIHRGNLKLDFEPVSPFWVSFISVSTEKADLEAAPYGAVIGGRLVVKGSLTKARIIKIVDQNKFAYKFFDAELYYDRYDRGTPLGLCHLDIPSEFLKEDTVTCLPLITENQKRGTSYTGESRIHGLILRKSGDYYQRVGHFTTSTRRKFDWPKELNPPKVTII